MTRVEQFVPILSGSSAFDVTFSADAQWASYASYPEGTLWRSRADGTERLQLTYPPTEVFLPFISPDGKRVAFGTVQGEVYVVNIDGSELQKIAGAYSIGANWSPDDSRIVMTHAAGTESEEQIFDFRTGQLGRALFPGIQEWAVGWARRIRCRITGHASLADLQHEHEYVVSTGPGGD